MASISIHNFSLARSLLWVVYIYLSLSPLSLVLPGTELQRQKWVEYWMNRLCCSGFDISKCKCNLVKIMSLYHILRKYSLSLFLSFISLLILVISNKIKNSICVLFNLAENFLLMLRILTELKITTASVWNPWLQGSFVTFNERWKQIVFQMKVSYKCQML